MVDLFTEQYPDINVDVETAPGNSYQQVVSTQLAGGTAADVIRAYPGDGSALSIIQASNNGFLEPLDEVDFGDQITDSQREVLESDDGELMAVPVTVSAIGGVYNTTAIDELGLQVPTTWSEVLAFCADAVDEGRVPYGLGLRDAWTGQFVSYALGATLLQPDVNEVQAHSDTPFSGTQWREVMNKYAELRDAGCFTEQPNGTAAANVATSVATGEALGTISLTTMVGTIQSEASTDTEIAFAPFPATNSADETRLSTGIGVVFAVNAEASDPEAATKLAEFFATPEAQATYAEISEMSPALDAGENYEPDQPTAVLTEYMEADRTASWPDQSWPNPRVQQAHFEAVQSLFAGDYTVDDVLAALDEAYLN